MSVPAKLERSVSIGPVDVPTLRRAWDAGMAAVQAAEHLLGTRAMRLVPAALPPMAGAPLEGPAACASLREIAVTLENETLLLEALREAVVEQGGRVAAGDVPAIVVGTALLDRTLLTLDETRRRRAGLVTHVTGGASSDVAMLEHQLGTLPPNIETALAAARRAAARVADAGVGYRETVRGALEAGHTSLQRLFAGEAAR